MKKLFIPLFMVLSVLSLAQAGRVGINTENPNTTMDVTGKVGTDGKSLQDDMTGLQAPRLSREELTLKGELLYSTPQKGALIYITDVLAGTATGQRVNVTTPGYYYFDGSFWQKLFTNTELKAENGLNKNTTTGAIELGGDLNKSTTIATTISGVTYPLSITGLPIGDNDDLLMVVSDLGQLKMINQSSLGASDINLYKDDGTLTSNRLVTMDGKSLTFDSTNERTIVTSTSGLQQLGKVNGANVRLTSPDGNANGILSNLYIQTFSENSAQILAGQDARALSIGTHFTSTVAPITFVTTTTPNTMGTEKARITGAGDMGIATNIPSERLDIGTGNVRVRQINSNISTNSADKVVVADANGVLKTTNFFVPYTSLIGLKTNQDASATAANTWRTIIFETNPTIQGMTYNSTTGLYTVNSAGFYQISASVNANVSSPGNGTASFILRKNGVVVNRVDNNSGTGATSTSQNMTFVVQFAANDTFDLQYAFTLGFRVTSGQVSAIKIGN